MMTYAHRPVLVDEVLEVLAPADGERFVDCTVGGGGHAEALLESADCYVVGLDRDPEAIRAASERLRRFGKRFSAVRSRFSDLKAVLADHGWDAVDGLLADIGVSSHQLDTPGRGFSFRSPGPLDMRMDPTASRSAHELVNEWDPDRLADIIRRFGEEPDARRIATAIVRGRPHTTTTGLAAVVASAVGSKKRSIHPATRTFQALRIAVNEELDELDLLLDRAVDLLRPGGRLAIITFHSLEDRRVKLKLRHEAALDADKDPYGNPMRAPRVRLSKPQTASDAEDNPRARSARLRAAVRIPWNESQSPS